MIFDCVAIYLVFLSYLFKNIGDQIHSYNNQQSHYNINQWTLCLNWIENCYKIILGKQIMVYQIIILVYQIIILVYQRSF